MAGHRDYPGGQDGVEASRYICFLVMDDIAVVSFRLRGCGRPF
jgi:hypothetical protein